MNENFKMLLNDVFKMTEEEANITETTTENETNIEKAVAEEVENTEETTNEIIDVEITEEPVNIIDFDINKYVEVKSKKGPTQGNVYDTMVKLIDLQNIDELKKLHALYGKHYDNCINRHYLSKKREQFLVDNNLI